MILSICSNTFPIKSSILSDKSVHMFVAFFRSPTYFQSSMGSFFLGLLGGHFLLFSISCCHLENNHFPLSCFWSLLLDFIPSFSVYSFILFGHFSGSFLRKHVLRGRYFENLHIWKHLYSTLKLDWYFGYKILVLK